MIGVLGQVFPIVGCHVKEFFRRLEGFDAGGACKSIPWACFLAGITTVDAVVHSVGCFGWDVVSFVFNGEIRKAAVGIQSGWVSYCFHGAGIEAGMASATVGVHGYIIV